MNLIAVRNQKGKFTSRQKIEGKSKKQGVKRRKHFEKAGIKGTLMGKGRRAGG